MHRARMQDQSDSFLAVDLTQTPAARAAKGGSLLPTMTRTSMGVCLRPPQGSTFQDHVFTADEIGMAQGWPTVKVPGNEMFQSCLLPALSTLKQGQRDSTVGNGIHISTWMAWQLYIAAHSIRKAVLEDLAPSLQLVDRAADADLDE